MSENNRPYYYTWSNQNIKGQAFPFDKDVVDLCSLSFQAIFGLNPVPVLKEIQKQMSTFSMAPAKADFSLKEIVSNKLINYLGFKDGKILYTVSGSESVENALKIARLYTGKNIIISRRNSYHGATLGSLSVTGDWRNQAATTIDHWTMRIPEPAEDPDFSGSKFYLEKNGVENIAAFCLETISGANGVIVPPDSWYKGIQDFCTEYGILLILDEVLTGFHRTGLPFAYHHYPFLKPDFVCMAKGISAGVIPFGAVWTNKKISEHFSDRILPCGLTQYANPLGLAATNAVLDEITSDNLLMEYEKREAILIEFFQSIENHQNVKEVRRSGLLAAIEYKSPYLLSASELAKKNVLVVTRDNHIVIAPDYYINLKSLQRALDIIKEELDNAF